MGELCKVEDCSICQETLTGDLVALLCGELGKTAHVYHLACIAPWIKQREGQTDCPLCRRKIFATARLKFEIFPQNGAPKLSKDSEVVDKCEWFWQREIKLLKAGKGNVETGELREARRQLQAGSDLIQQLQEQVGSVGRALSAAEEAAEVSAEKFRSLQNKMSQYKTMVQAVKAKLIAAELFRLLDAPDVALTKYGGGDSYVFTEMDAKRLSKLLEQEPPNRLEIRTALVEVMERTSGDKSAFQRLEKRTVMLEQAIKKISLQRDEVRLALTKEQKMRYDAERSRKRIRNLGITVLPKVREEETRTLGIEEVPEWLDESKWIMEGGQDPPAPKRRAGEGGEVMLADWSMQAPGDNDSTKLSAIRPLSILEQLAGGNARS